MLYGACIPQMDRDDSVFICEHNIRAEIFHTGRGIIFYGYLQIVFRCCKKLLKSAIEIEKCLVYRTSVEIVEYFVINFIGKILETSNQVRCS